MPIRKLKISETQIALFLLITGVTLNYTFDGVNKLSNLYFPTFSRVAIIYRLLLEFVCLSTIILFFNKTRLTWMSWFFYFTISFFIGNLYLKYIIEINVSLIEQFVYFNKYFFIFFIFFATYKVLEDRSSLQKVIENFKKVFIFNGYLAVLGLLFNIKLFSTFPTGTPRFGYDGLILAQNEASIFYLLALFVYYYDWKINQKPLIQLLFALFLCAITGMKAVYLGIILLMLFHFFSRMSTKKLIYLFFGILVSAVVLVLSFSKIKLVFGYYFYFFSNKGFLFTILGGRNTFIETRVLPYLEKLDIVNYTIGGQNISNPNDYIALVEMDFIDVFLFFGLLNGVIFLFLYKKHIIGSIKNKLFYFMVIVFFLQSFFSGHFFTSSVNPIFIIIVFAYINTYINDKAVY